MSKPSHPLCSDLSLDIPPLVHLWLLRLIVPLGGHKEFLMRDGFASDDLALGLGLAKWIDPVHEGFDKGKIMTALRKFHRTEEQKIFNASTPPLLLCNTARLAALVGLTSTDCRILEYVVLVKNVSLLDDASDCIGQLSTISTFRALSIILNIPEPEIRDSLSPQGALTRSGLLTFERNGLSRLGQKLDLLSENFADSIYCNEIDPVNLLRGMVVPSSLAELCVGDYKHIHSDLSILQPYLKKSINFKRKGVNIFVHGAPGTGKSQLAKVLAKEMSCELFEVASEDDEGDPITGEKRLRAFRVAQMFFAQQRSILVFDETEDVFDDGDNFFGRKSTAQTRKAWINRMLEENPVPTIWLSNSIHGIDPAFLRRFDMVFELPMPPKEQRERILLENCGDLLNENHIARIAEVENLAPALIAKTASVIRLINDDLGAKGTPTAFEQLLNNTLMAQGHKTIRKHHSNSLPEFYDPSFIHCDADLARVADGLAASQSGRLCLYGPPGTGKTAYGRWLAEKLGIPLQIKRASDLMSMWVGGNEKNIATAFRQAEQNGALLLIDEVDSFLQDRRGSRQSWELSLVNEMLTQMESFSGVFIASTNLMEGLDQAALRRFDLKVKFDFLRYEQAWALLGRYCAELKFSAPDENLCTRVKSMQQLTLGDFAAVLRQHRFRAIENADGLVAALEAECAVKEGVKQSIGFTR